MSDNLCVCSEPIDDTVRRKRHTFRTSISRATFVILACDSWTLPRLMSLIATSSPHLYDVSAYIHTEKRDETNAPLTVHAELDLAKLALSQGLQQHVRSKVDSGPAAGRVLIRLRDRSAGSLSRCACRRPRCDGLYIDARSVAMSTAGRMSGRRVVLSIGRLRDDLSGSGPMLSALRTARSGRRSRRRELILVRL